MLGERTPLEGFEVSPSKAQTVEWRVSKPGTGVSGTKAAWTGGRRRACRTCQVHAKLQVQHANDACSHVREGLGFYARIFFAAPIRFPTAADFPSSGAR